jgi:hypothetical protein
LPNGGDRRLTIGGGEGLLMSNRSRTTYA